MAELGRRKRYTPRDLERIEVNVQRLRRAGLPRVQDISRRELRRIKDYTLAYDPATWERITRRRGALSYALLLHEQAEVQFFVRHGINWQDENERDVHYREAHAFALRMEHEFLQRVAENRGHRGLGLGTLVAQNLSVGPHSRQFDLEVIAEFWSRKEARVVESEVPEARSFFEEVMQEWE